ncbi:Ankyrin repeat domain-containing protein 13B [Penaeus vannamei]|uniref:Ankyrin repeat domain-containing protein 13B n=1 Tax=Penaeus vannamei TaxID=6689 RepID=A0A3R7P8W5_PENVA|nr:Ankyrin repeat domain-containing protein 13B [Penaeus vannamei]
MEEGGPAEGKDGSQNEDSGPESAEGTVENAQATACSANVQNSIDTKGREGREGYPLHWLVWHNDYRNLETELASGKHDKELKDFRGRTPLMLAVTLGHLEATRTLLKYNCNGNVVLEGRDVERYSSRVAGIPTLLEKLKEAPDFYVEMKWEFTSWVPLVSRMCPSDTYKVYKSGSSVRIDTTLLGFDQTSWQRGNRSYIFNGQGSCELGWFHCGENGTVCVEQRFFCDKRDDCPAGDDEVGCVDEEGDSRLTKKILDRPVYLWEHRHNCSLPRYPTECTCRKLTRIHCVNKELTSVPQNIADAVTALIFTNNSIDLLHGSFSIYPDVRLLSLANNSLSELRPGALQGLASLSNLDVSRNQLRHFDDILAHLPTLLNL